MSETVVKLRPARVKCRSVELAKRQEVDSWALADAVREDVHAVWPQDREHSRSHGINTGLTAAEDAVYAQHEEARTDISRSYLHDLFRTAEVWPPEERRTEIATFSAHYELRGQQWRNRGAVLERLARKSATGRVAQRQVRVWKSEQNPPALRTFLQLVEQRVRSSLKAAAAPWHTVKDGDRTAIARILREIANEVEDGTFPKGQR